MLKTIIKLPDGTEISSGSNSVNAIQSVTLTECVNSGEDLTIGSTCANALEVTLITPGGVLDIPAGTRVTVLKQDGDNAPMQVGVFNLEKPTRPSANRMKLTGYDRVAELDKDLTDWLHALNKQDEWNYTLTEFASVVCAACGLTFKVTDVPNAGFPVPRFTRSAVTGRQIMQWLGEICCRFCRADVEGNIEFAWYEPSGKTITPEGELYYLQNGLSYEDYTTQKINAVRLRLANSTDGALWPAAVDGENSYIITDNAILNARITEDLLPHLLVIQEELADIAYTPCKVTVPICLDIRAGSIVEVYNKKGVPLTMLVMTKTTKGQMDTLECTGNRRRDTAAAVNSQSQSATAAAAAQNAFAGMTQEQIFKKLTDDGKIEGLYMLDGQLYINASYIKTGEFLANLITAGVLKSKDGSTFYLDLDKGELKLNASELFVSGKPIAEIAGQGTLTQSGVFNALTNNGALKGLYMQNGELYINASYLRSGTVSASLIDGASLVITKGSTIAGWNIDNNSIYKTPTGKGYKDGTFMSTGTGNSYIIGGSGSISGWVFGAGGKFGVTKDGAVYANDVHLQGEIDAQSGTIGGWDIGTTLSSNKDVTIKSATGTATWKQEASMEPDGIKVVLTYKSGNPVPTTKVLTQKIYWYQLAQITI